MATRARCVMRFKVAMEKDYEELFCLITFTDERDFFAVPCEEIDHPEMAEVFIPYKREGINCAITCYITNWPNWYPVPGAILLLQSAAEQLYQKLKEIGGKSNG